MARFSGTLLEQQPVVETDFVAQPQQDQISTPPNQVDIQAQLERMFGETAPVPQRQPAKQDYFGSGVIEPARALASGASRQVIGGAELMADVGGAVIRGEPAIKGLERGVESVESWQSGAFQPRTESGQRNMQKIGDLMEAGIDVARIPLSNIAGIGELISGQGIEQANQTVQDVRQEGWGDTAARRVLEETGSPLLATLLETSPDIFASIYGIKGVKATPRVRITTPTKTRIAEKLKEGSNDPVVAKYKLTEEPSKRINNYITLGAKEIIKDPVAIKAIDSGFDEGVVATIKGASQQDKTAMLKMVDIFEKGKKDARFGMVNRAGDVAGDTLLERYRVVLKTNKDAGKKLDSVAESELKGQQVRAYEAYSGLIDDLDQFGVTYSDDMKPIFKGSDLQGMAGAKDAVTRIFNRINSTNPNDAYALHRMKRYIDMIVSYGKQTEGLPANVEAMLKNFRRGIDTELDTFSPKYNEINTRYSDTIGAIDSLQDVAGTKMNLSGANADKAVGTLARRLMSNAQSRVTLLDAIVELEAVAAKYGAQFTDDLLTQVLFADELDSILGGAPRASFKGQIMQAIEANIPTTTTGMVIEAGKATVKAVKDGKTPKIESQIKVIRDLLNESK
jgi:hypothetical protein